MTRFQIIFTTILVAFGVGGVILFAVSKNSSSEDNAPQLSMWGTVDSELVNGFLTKIQPDYKKSINIVYTEKNPVTMESELISALARSNGPDLILLPQDLVVAQLDKFYVVPFANYSERLFKDSFIEQGELYFSPVQSDGTSGIVGFPFTVDPLIMFWNRDMFRNAGVALPPTSWTEFFTLAPKITKKDENGNILQSTIAFGEVRNVTHAKDIIALLALQAGTPIVTRTAQGGYTSVFDMPGVTLPPGQQAISYFTEFSNPLKTSYSWNRSLVNDRSAFLAGRLAVYFGYASEIRSLREANPNLNFDVAMVPQVEDRKVSFGRMNAVAILKASPNVGAAYVAAVTLVSAPLQIEWQTISGFPPVRRDLLTIAPTDAFGSVVYQSALVSNGWLDPNTAATNDIFQRLVENVTSGKLRASEAVRAASLEIGNLLQGTR